MSVVPWPAAFESVPRPHPPLDTGSRWPVSDDLSDR
ncbi:hypothetical protein F4560_000042 [Saccharothrix ecbatanensis]|uniref:Uncharacterized protein n=1 Tax=Saccharothrix ecbatanensis TaxID=1105145 RepID=A0A7W9HE29_9PSEU|nr:hypothetical protein [Saccharothrix ecbatanensis]